MKARLTLLVLLTTAVGFYLGATPPLNYAVFFHVVFRNGARPPPARRLSINGGNDRLDALMLRTKARPIPAGRMRPRDALIIGTVLAIGGLFISILPVTD